MIPWNRILFGLLAAGWFAAPPCPAQTAPYQDFESSGDPAWAGSGSSIRRSRPGEPVHSGTYSLRIDTTATWNYNDILPGDSWPAAVLRDPPERLVFYTYALPAGGGWATDNTVGVKFYDSDKYKADGVEIWTTDQARYGQWTELCIALAQLPADFDRLRIGKVEIKNYWPGTYYLDDLQLVKPELLYQDFEGSGESGWAGSGSTVRLSNQGEPVRCGARSLRIDSGINWNYNFVRSRDGSWDVDFTGRGGDRLTLWSYGLPTKDATGPAAAYNNMAVKFYDNSKYSQEGSEIWTSNKARCGEWTKSSVSFAQLPADFGMHHVNKLEIKSYWPGTYYVDDVEVTRYPSESIAIQIDDAVQQYQEIEGFGASLTDSSAWLLWNSLAPDARLGAMEDLFDPIKGIGISYIRQPIGTSDFVEGPYYTYDDVPKGKTDPNLEHFSIDPDKAYIIPLLQQAVKLSPGLSIMGTPWSAPAWMKDSDDLMSGHLRGEVYDTYASYLAKYIQAYQAQSLKIRAITLQNEPGLDRCTYPCMGMTAAEQAKLAKSVGKVFQANAIDTRILAWDHNWDQPAYPRTVLDDPDARKYVAGAAFHCYCPHCVAGTGPCSVAAQSAVASLYPEKDIYFTECSGMVTEADFGHDLIWRVSNLVIGATRNWARSVILWNLALDENNGPVKQGGCSNCRGVITVSQKSKKVSGRTVDYYVLGHAAKFVRPGARRIYSTDSPGEGIENVAFRNPDGSYAAIVLNADNVSHAVAIQWRSRWFRYALPGGSVATFTWANDPNSAVSVWLTTGDRAKLLEKQPDTAFLPAPIVNAASLSGDSGLAPASLASAFGQFAVTQGSPAMIVKDAEDPKPVEWLPFVSSGQMNFVVPEDTQVGPATVAVNTGGGAVVIGTARIEPVAPGLFSANGDGRGAAAGVATFCEGSSPCWYQLLAECGLAPGSCLAEPLDLRPEARQVFLSLYGTGIRGRSALAAVKVTAGGEDVPVRYAGAQGQYPGLDQVNIGPLPRTLAGRGEVAVEVRVDGKTANRVSISLR
ncbi:MAG TPA: glycoside hydrolase family 30 beta sandwich domain-containing protein [Bryobacteraceae bacterium]|nr:glycoside hydrolase family 30 beta sandwich domain-containing protein [Bryobacteraceae bacterium]